MRHTPHQPAGAVRLTQTIRKNDFQVIKTHFDAIKCKYTLTTSCSHVHAIILTPSKQQKSQINNKTKKQA